MNLNPLYHLRRYRTLSDENDKLSQRVHTLEAHIFHLETTAKRQKQELERLRRELYEIEQEFELVVVSKTLSRKEARELRHKRGQNGKQTLPR